MNGSKIVTNVTLAKQNRPEPFEYSFSVGSIIGVCRVDQALCCFLVHEVLVLIGWSWSEQLRIYGK